MKRLFLIFLILAFSSIAYGGDKVIFLGGSGSADLSATTSGQILRNNGGVLADSVLQDDGTDVTIPNGSSLVISSGASISLLGNWTGDLSVSGVITGGIGSATLTTCEGSDDTSTNAAFLTDSGESWPTNEYIGMTLYNTTDSSSCTVTANTGTTMTCTLAGGTDNDWDSGDGWAVAPGPSQSGYIFYIGAATTILHPATANYAAIYFSTTAATIKVDPQSDSMQFTLDGTATGTNGEELDSAGAAGDFIAIHNVSTTSAFTLGRSGTWTDGGAS